MPKRSNRVWCAVALSCCAMAFSLACTDQTAPLGPETAGSSAAPDGVVTNSVGMKFAYCPPGRFTMGSPIDEPGRHDDEGQHPVTIGRGFYLGVTEVTQGQFQRVMGFNRSEIKGDDLPVNRISWGHADVFCKKLSLLTGRRYRLPTEAEWEYACRAGAAGPFAGSGKLDEMGWHMDNSDEAPHPVAARQPNAWGLYDMHGGVLEWCADWYARDYPAEAVADPNGPVSGKYRVARGGSWGHFARACRSAARANFNPAYQLEHLGLRVLMDPNDPDSEE